MGDHETVKLTRQKSFGKRYDVSKHISNTKNSSRRTPRRNFDHKMMKIQKKVENDENWNFDKFGCRGHSAFGIGAKHI